MESARINRLKEKTILLVEDEAVIRNNIASMLQFFFKEVRTAGDGYAGLDAYRKYQPDIVMTDLKMPYMGGFEMLQEISQRSNTVYTIVVSAHTDTDLLLNAVNNGINRYIVKPVTEQQLFEAFESFLDATSGGSASDTELLPGLTLDSENQTLRHHNETIHLNKKETLLLRMLSREPTHTFTYEEIETQVWGEKSMSLASLRSVVRDIRKKSGEKIVENVSGTGYRLR